MGKRADGYQDNTGATTIIVVCVMAVVMALSLGLFLTAAVLVKTSARTLAVEQSRILAVTFSEEVEKMLTEEGENYNSRRDEDAGKLINASGITMFQYVKQNISDGSWAYYDEKEGAAHDAASAVRSFHLSDRGITGEVADITLDLYWTRKEQSQSPGMLFVKTTAEVKGQSCTVTDVYELSVQSMGDYEKWLWKHREKK